MIHHMIFSWSRSYKLLGAVLYTCTCDTLCEMAGMSGSVDRSGREHGDRGRVSSKNMIQTANSVDGKDAGVIVAYASMRLSSPASRQSRLRSARRLTPLIRAAQRDSAGVRKVKPRCELMTPMAWRTALRASREK